MFDPEANNAIVLRLAEVLNGRAQLRCNYSWREPMASKY